MAGGELEGRSRARQPYHGVMLRLCTRALGVCLLLLEAGCAHAPEQQAQAPAAPVIVVDVAASGDDAESGAASAQTLGVLTEVEEGDEAPDDAARATVAEEKRKPEKKKRELDKKLAENAGILGLLRAPGAGKSASAPTGIIWGGSIGDSFGAGGLGLSGMGQGGGAGSRGAGGGGTGTIGLGRIGRGSGGTGYGTGIGTSRGRGRTTQVKPAAPLVHGALDKDVIQRIMRRHVSQVRYCYERALQQDPSLTGKLKVKFVIGPDGKVTSAAALQPFQAEVDRCVLSVIRRLRFPSPQGGGVVIVNYPYLFSTQK